MDHWTKTGIRDKPLSTGIYGEVDGLFRTKIYTDTAAFTFNGINDKRFANGVPSAQIPAQAALDAFVRTNNSRSSPLKIVAFFYIGVHEQMKIGGIHIRITKNFVFSQ
jgi:hypothetical protein